jgi:hypothetical protein
MRITMDPYSGINTLMSLLSRCSCYLADSIRNFWILVLLILEYNYGLSYLGISAGPPYSISATAARITLMNEPSWYALVALSSNSSGRLMAPRNEYASSIRSAWYTMVLVVAGLYANWCRNTCAFAISSAMYESSGSRGLKSSFSALYWFTTSECSMDIR